VRFESGVGGYRTSIDAYGERRQVERWAGHVPDIERSVRRGHVEGHVGRIDTARRHRRGVEIHVTTTSDEQESDRQDRDDRSRLTREDDPEDPRQCEPLRDRRGESEHDRRNGDHKRGDGDDERGDPLRSEEQSDGSGHERHDCDRLNGYVDAVPDHATVTT